MFRSSQNFHFGAVLKQVFRSKCQNIGRVKLIPQWHKHYSAWLTDGSEDSVHYVQMGQIPGEIVLLKCAPTYAHSYACRLIHILSHTDLISYVVSLCAVCLSLTLTLTP